MSTIKGSRGPGGRQRRRAGRRLGCELSACPGQAGATSARAVSCDGRRGNGRWPIVARTGRCPAAKRLPVPTVGRSGGAGSSRMPARPVRSAPSTHNHRDSPLTNGETVLRPDVSAISRGCRIGQVGQTLPSLPALSAANEDGSSIAGRG